MRQSEEAFEAQCMETAKKFFDNPDNRGRNVLKFAKPLVDCPGWETPANIEEALKPSFETVTITRTECDEWHSRTMPLPVRQF